MKKWTKADTKVTFHSRYFIKGLAELIGSFPSNQNTLYLLCLFYSDNEIITVCCRPEICTLIGWIETSRLCLSLSKVSLLFTHKHNPPTRKLFLVSNERYGQNKTSLPQCYCIDFAPIKRYCPFCFYG